MRQPLAILVTDSHYNKKNLEEVNDCLFQSVQRGVELGVKFYFHTGDIFTSRYGRSFEELKAFNEYVTLLEDSDFEAVVIIPGNHDKKDQSSPESYLDIFHRNNSSVEIVSEPSEITYGNFSFWFLPFFSEGVYSDKIVSTVSKLKRKQRNFLFTHVAVNGVKNNDGSIVDNDFNADIFSAFEKVFVGHYHDRQEFENIVYFGSLKQNNFGEDKAKGWVIFYDDGSFEYEQSFFTQFINLKIDLNKASVTKLINIYKEKYGNNPDFFTRITLTGSESQLAEFDSKEFLELGIDLKKVTDNDKVITFDDLRIQNKNFQEYFIDWSSKLEEIDKELMEQLMEEYVANK